MKKDAQKKDVQYAFSARTFGFASLLALAPSAALAHAGHIGHVGADGGALAGLAHPFLGADHFLAMLAVGLWAAAIGGAARWIVPASFVAAMALGAALVSVGGSSSGVEPIISASVVVLGLAAAFNLRLPVALGAGLAAIFAVAHGMAHGAEIPAGANFWAYGAGFAVATAALHALGVGLGSTKFRLARSMGAATAGFGLLMVFAG